jgi:hypothetical protein
VSLWIVDRRLSASSIVISDENPETIFVHPPWRPLRDHSGIGQSNLPFSGRPPLPSIPIQDDSNSATTANNTRLSYAEIRRRQASATSELEALIQRQRRSHLETRRISVLAEEIRRIVGSSGNNPAANSQAQQSVPELTEALGGGYFNTTLEPTPERRNYARTVPNSTTSEPPFTRYHHQSLDPSSFTPGPFRNTVQQLFNNERRHTQHRPDPSPSVPPTIPPLSFEDNDLSTSLHQRILLHQFRRPTESAQATSSSSTSTRDTVDERLRQERAIAEEGLRHEQQAMNLRQISDRLRGMGEGNRRREGSDIHWYLTQQARMEASRLQS